MVGDTSPSAFQKPALDNGEFRRNRSRRRNRSSSSARQFGALAHAVREPSGLI